MMLTRRRALTGIAAAITLASRRADAIVVPESTLRAEGLRPFIKLAHQAQFAPLVALSNDGGEDWNAASATWIGNFGGTGHLLTAAHVFDRDGTVDDYLYRTRSGRVHHGKHLITHPLFDWDHDKRSGYDAAIIQLDGPVTDSGPPPLLFGNELEGGERIVFVGFGARGTGARGEHDALDTPDENKTAAENTVDEVMDPVEPPIAGEDAGNWLRITLHRESESGSRLGLDTPRRRPLGHRRRQRVGNRRRDLRQPFLLRRHFGPPAMARPQAAGAAHRRVRVAALGRLLYAPPL